MRVLRSAVLTLAAFLIATAAFAQLQSGNVFGTVVDSQGQPIPGVTVTLSGLGATQMFVTDNQGAFRFLSLDPGRWMLTAELSGFSTVKRPVEVNLARNSQVTVNLQPAVQEAITITAETPLIDTRKTGTGQNVTRVELDQVPTARDPWVVLQSIPGVLVDRVNVGGNQSGQQSYFVSKGVERHQTEWNLDGVNVSDASTAMGSSGFYYDFDSFEELNFTTSGSDPSIKTPGVQINMVARRGTNELRGSTRFFWTDESVQADPTVPEEARSYLQQSNSVENIQEYGGEAGGPIIRERLWLWGAGSRNEITNFVYGGTFPQETMLQNWTAKVNGQVLQNNNANLFYAYNDKTVEGRGVSSTRPPEAARNQSGPGWVWKLEDTHVFSPNLYATLLAARIVNGYRLDPRNGDVEPYWEQRGGSFGATGWRRNADAYKQDMPQDNYRLDGSSFFDLAATNHELKWGFNYRDAPVESWSIWPGNMSFGNFYRTYSAAGMTRPAHPIYRGQYTELYVGDTVLFGDLTLTGGFRYDQQRARNLPSSVPANPVIPEVLPEASFGGDDRELEWTSISPRLGVTYALGGQNRTVIRGGYNRYVDQLSSAEVGANNPFWVDQIIYYYWEDLNGDQTVQRNEIDFEEGPYAFIGIDPNNTAGGNVSTGRIDYSMDPTRTDEVFIGAEHEIMTGFSVGLNFTARRRDDFNWSRYEKTRGSGDFYTTADYEPAPPITGTLPNGEKYSIPIYRLKTGVPEPVYSVTTNRDGYTQTYRGIELTATKRMTGNWMMRGNVTWNDWKQHVDAEAIVDPSPLLLGDGCYTCDDSAVASSSGADGYINSRWSAALNGVYKMPWDVMVGAAVTAREGYIIGYHRRERPRRSTVRTRYVIGEFGENRLDDLFQLDLRIAKDFRLPAGLALNLSADLFNATNERTILWRGYELFADVGGNFDSSGGRIERLQSPRIWRFGARVTF